MYFGLSIHPVPKEIIDSFAGEAGSSPLDDVTVEKVVSFCEQNIGLAF